MIASSGSSASSIWRTAVGAAWLAMVVAGCAVDGLSFVQDERVQIISPSSNATIELPFVLRWESESPDATFAVFFDGSPVRPGQSLLALVPEDDPCRTESSCPDASWLAKRDIYVTSDTRLAVERLPDLRDTNRAKDRHDVTIVLLGDDGKRLSEVAYTREFIVGRGS